MGILSVSADATLRGYAPECIREPYLRAIGARGFEDRKVLAAITFAEAAARFFVALLAPEGGPPRALIGKLDRTSLGDWVATADELARKVVALPDAVARPAALALRDAQGKQTPACKALHDLIPFRNEGSHGQNMGFDTPKALHAYQTVAEPALRDLIEGLGFVRVLPIYALDRLHPSTGRPTRLLRFAGPEPEVLAFNSTVGVKAMEPLLIAADGRAVELGPFMAANLSAATGLRLQLLEKFAKNHVYFGDPAGRGYLEAQAAWKDLWLGEGTLRTPLMTGPDPGLSAAVQRAPERLTGRGVGPYTFEGFIARGASASVYRGRSPHGPVALKVLHTPLRTSASHRERLRRELELLQRFRHPRIVQAHDLLEDTEYGPILVMDLAQGVDLERVFGAKRASVHEASTLAMQVLDALGALHAHGVVHRDIKPANVLVDQGEVLLVDFGIARDPAQDRMTGTLDRLGTRSFAAPEQIGGTEVGPPADLFAVGRLLSWLVTGEPTDDGLGALPPGLAAWVRAATRPDPAERFASAAAMADALQAVLAHGLDAGAPLSVGDSVIHQHYRVVGAPKSVAEATWAAAVEETSTGAPARLWCAPRGQAGLLRTAVERLLPLSKVVREDGGLYCAVFPELVDVLAGPPVPPVVGVVEAPPEHPDTAPAQPLPAEGPLGLPGALPDDPGASRRRVEFAWLVAEAALRAVVEDHTSAVAWFRAGLPGGRPAGLDGRLALLDGLVARGPARGRGMDGLLRRAMVVLPQVAARIQAARQVSDDGARYGECLEIIELLAADDLPSPVLRRTTEGWILAVHARPSDGARRLASPDTPAPIPPSLQADTLRDWNTATLFDLGMVRIDRPEGGLGGANLRTNRFDVGYDATGKARVVVGYEPELDLPAGRRLLTTHAVPWMQRNMVRLLGYTDGLQWKWVRREGVRELPEVLNPALWLRQNPR